MTGSSAGTWTSSSPFSGPATPTAHLPRGSSISSSTCSRAVRRHAAPGAQAARLAGPVDNTVHGREGRAAADLHVRRHHPRPGLLRPADRGDAAKIGELDEEFVWERASGDTLPWGPRCGGSRGSPTTTWRWSRPTGGPGSSPSGRRRTMNRDFHFSEQILLFLEECNDRLDDPALRDELRQDYFLDDAAADELIGHLEAATGGNGRRSPPPPPSAHRALPRSPEHLGHEAGHPPHPLGRTGQPSLRPGPPGGLGGEIPLPPRGHRRTTTASSSCCPTTFPPSELFAS